MRKSVVIVGVLVAGVALAGCHLPVAYPLDTTVDASDGQAIFEAILTDGAFKDLADRVAPVVVLADVRDSDPQRVGTYYYRYADDEVETVGASDPDFTLTTSYDIALSVINADADGPRVFACALKANAVTFEATNIVYAASFNAAKGRIIGSTTDCAPKDGQKISFRGNEATLINGTPGGYPRHIARFDRSSFDVLSYNSWRAPLAWHLALDVWDCGADWCSGSGTTSTSADMTTCAAAVEEAYGSEEAEGWDAGLKAAAKTRKAAELAACRLVLRGT